MGKIISVVSQKGGVGKTTTTANLGAALAREGKLVLLVEVDPQGALAPSFGLEAGEWAFGLEHVLRGERPAATSILPTPVEGLSILPATGPAPDELEMEQLLSTQPHSLAEVLDRLAPQYDVILLDGSPTLGSLCYATLYASDSYLVPVQAEEFSYRTIDRMLEFAERVRNEGNPKLECQGLLITMADLRTRMSIRVVNQLHQNYGDRLMMSMVPRMVALSEMPLRGLPAVIYAESSKGATAYREVAMELLLDLESPQAELVAQEEFEAEFPSAPLLDDRVEPNSDARNSRPAALEGLRNVNPELLLTAFGGRFEGFDLENDSEDEDLRIH